MRRRLIFAALALALGLIPAVALARDRRGDCRTRDCRCRDHRDCRCRDHRDHRGHDRSPTGDPCQPPITTTTTTTPTTTTTTATTTATVTTPTATTTVTVPQGPVVAPAFNGTTTTITIIKTLKPKPCHTALGSQTLGPLPTRFDHVKRVSVQGFGHRIIHTTFIGHSGHRYTRLRVSGLACGVYPMTINDWPNAHAVVPVLRIWVIRHHSLTRVGWPDWPTPSGLS
jgi:hypothetical protein